MFKFILSIFLFASLNCFAQYDYQKAKCQGIFYRLKKQSSKWICKKIQSHKQRDFYCLNGYSRDNKASSANKTCKKLKASSSKVALVCPGVGNLTKTETVEYSKCDVITTEEVTKSNFTGNTFKLDIDHYNSRSKRVTKTKRKGFCTARNTKVTKTKFDNAKPYASVGVSGAQKGFLKCSYATGNALAIYNPKSKYKSCSANSSKTGFECIKK